MPDTWGDQAFEAFFTSQAHRLRRLAYAMCGDWHLAEDLVQAAFVRMYPRWHRIRPETAAAYANKVLLNLFLSGVPKRKREQVMESFPDTQAPEGRSSDERLDMAAALAALPPKRRAMVVLRFMEDLSISEVAQLTGTAEGTVKSQTSRAVESLRVALGLPEGADEDAGIAF
nr:SigE family RNA polymerase sigma factor [Kibdelosporangium sp. MJ126-NF4]CEL16670.1 RNA polymerase ECF sigma factor [Kibdelosporangium sp. MJ126-NF4]CTQ88978.1 RNA polymerase ECF sigma factor [Kibdelosporangium sp. MJ126-NF4]